MTRVADTEKRISLLGNVCALPDYRNIGQHSTPVSLPRFIGILSIMALWMKFMSANRLTVPAVLLIPCRSGLPRPGHEPLFQISPTGLRIRITGEKRRKKLKIDCLMPYMRG